MIMKRDFIETLSVHMSYLNQPKTFIMTPLHTFPGNGRLASGILGGFEYCHPVAHHLTTSHTEMIQHHHCLQEIVPVVRP